MPKPSSLPRWADVSGDITEPSSGKKDVGWVTAEKPAAQYFNWWMKLVYDWMAWLDNPDDLDFTGTLQTVDFSVSGQTDLTDTNVSGTLSADGPVKATNVLTPATLSGTPNHNYAPTGHGNAFLFRLTPDAASREITGLAGGTAGRVVCLANVAATGSGFTVIIPDETETGSTAANRFIVPSDVTINPNESVLFIYDGTSSRWRRLNK